jgi:SAM-dependent methyltransferase
MNTSVQTNGALACQGCGAPLTQTLVDLGMSPLANSFVPPARAAAEDPVYPLHARVCNQCLLVQVESVVPAEDIFSSEYAYFSSFSISWLAHCERYAAKVIARFGLGANSHVVEVASNDGYLLQNFVKAGIPALGVEPAANVAAVARAKGVPTEVAFFGSETALRLAKEGRSADLLAAKNVLAHVPDINDFVAGVRAILKPEGVFTVEFPHLLNLLQQVQFDTIYHEHYTYLSLLALEKILDRHGLRIFDVEEVPTHGGSLRVFVCCREASHALQPAVAAVRRKEVAARMDRPEGYQGFQARCEKVRADLLAFLSRAQTEGKSVAGYGAAAKGNTLLNFCGVGTDQIALVADLNPVKQNMLLPGSHIPVTAPAAIDAMKADYILILPWNIRDEVIEQMTPARDWGAKFVTAIPEMRVS